MTTLPVQSKEKLERMRADYACHGRIVKISERQKKDGEPFWLVTVRMKRWIEKEVWTGVTGEIKGEYQTGEWTFVSWHPIPNAAPDRILHFDLTGNAWQDHEEIGAAEVDWTTRLKPVKAAETKPAAKKTGKFWTGVVTERGIVYMRLQLEDSEIECVLPRISPKAMWIVDCITDKIAKDPQFSPVLRPEVFRFSMEEIIALKFDSSVLGDLPAFELTDDEIREKTGRTDLHNSEIEKLFKEIKKAVFEVEQKCFYEGGKWREVNVFSSLLSDLVIDKKGTASRRKNIPEASKAKRVYRFKLGTVCGAVVMSNLARRQFQIFPKEFYKMDLKAQELCRYACLFLGAAEGINIPLETASRIANITYNEPYRRIQKVAIRLKEAADVLKLRLIKKGEGERTIFTLTNRLPQKVNGKSGGV